MSRSIALLALPDVQLLDVAGPLDVFAEANAQSGHAAYSLALIATEPGPITTSSGRRLLPDRVAPADAGDAFDTLLVAGAPRIHEGRSGPISSRGSAGRRRAAGATALSAAAPSCWAKPAS